MNLRKLLVDLLQVSSILVCVVVSLLTHDLYHSVSSGQSVYFLLGIFFALLVVVLATGCIRPAWHDVLLGTCFASSFAVWIWYVVLNGAISSSPRIFGLSLRPLHMVGFAIFLALVFHKVGRLDRIGRSLVVACILFVATPLVSSAIRAEKMSWPLPQRMQDAESTSLRATLFVLFDELDGRSAKPLVQDLSQLGLEVQFKTVPSVGDATAKTIPAMFAGVDFSSAKPCGLTAICSKGNVLDFGKIEVTLNDVDVIGLYHPYCAMKGLRYCARVPFSLDFFDASRWRCGAGRLLTTKPDGSECLKFSKQVWADFIDRIELALWNAPIWKRGGFLFAHLPYPHPPGNSPDGQLWSDYGTNVARARKTLTGMVNRLHENGIQDISIVVFSDHPLRVDYWCTTNLYKGKCGNLPPDNDTSTPLIVATTGGKKNLDMISSNGDIFKLAAQLVTRGPAAAP
ncbi:MAG: hypothetical protein HY020_02030 [Burkholderiales bacterium]|nr:hypothetical protein [Burkholderiales bacterium]